MTTRSSIYRSFQASCMPAEWIAGNWIAALKTCATFCGRNRIDPRGREILSNDLNELYRYRSSYARLPLLTGLSWSSSRRVRSRHCPAAKSCSQSPPIATRIRRRVGSPIAAVMRLT